MAIQRQFDNRHKVTKAHFIWEGYSEDQVNLAMSRMVKIEADVNTGPTVTHISSDTSFIESVGYMFVLDSSYPSLFNRFVRQHILSSIYKPKILPVDQDKALNQELDRLCATENRTTAGVAQPPPLPKPLKIKCLDSGLFSGNLSGNLSLFETATLLFFGFIVICLCAKFL